MDHRLLLVATLLLAAPLARLALPQESAATRLGDPLPGLSTEELRLFAAGEVLFAGKLTEAEGLGPAHNDAACGLCHFEPTLGGGSSRTVVRFGRSGPPFDDMRDHGGGLLQELGTNPAVLELIPPEADVFARRVSSPVYGAGLVERIPDAALIANAGPEGAGGRPHWVTPLEGGPPRVGRFGWKSQIATVLSFTADASRNELGLTNRLIAEENAPGGDRALIELYDRVPDPEDRADADGFARIDRIAHYQRFLAPPPQSPRSGLAGEAVFTRAGCAECHVRSFTTGPGPHPAFDRVTIRPYSDFLLHDMDEHGDGIGQGDAGPSEMRTAPLWGLAHRRFLMHDGAATGGTLEDAVDAAVARHGGAAAGARERYAALAPREREELFEFLRSLGRAPGRPDVPSSD